MPEFKSATDEYLQQNQEKERGRNEGLELALIRIDDKSRLVVPKRLRKKLCIGPGNCLFLYAFENLLIARKAESAQTCINKTLKYLKRLDAGGPFPAACP